MFWPTSSFLPQLVTITNCVIVMSCVSFRESHLLAVLVQASSSETTLQLTRVMDREWIFSIFTAADGRRNASRSVVVFI